MRYVRNNNFIAMLFICVSAAICVAAANEPALADNVLYGANAYGYNDVE